MLFEAGNGAALTSAITGLLAAPERWPALRAAARHYVETERNWTNSVARYAPVYSEVLERMAAR